MRRVLAVIGFSSFFVTLFCIKFGTIFAVCMSVLSSLLLLSVICFKKIRYWILILVFATSILSSLNFVVTDNKINEYKEIYCKESVEISGVLQDYPRVNESGFLYTFKTNDKNNVKFTVMTNDSVDIEPGDILSGTFDFSDTYSDYTEKIYFSTYVYSNETLTVTPQNDKFNIAKFRKTLKQGIVDNTTVARGITKAIVFSDESGISDKVYEGLHRCGLLHATATSGLHLTIVTGFVFAFLHLIGLSKKRSSVIAMIFIVLFMIVIG
ncbi:MAG: ComEC/Rec2 family competence protein, partial [Clostridia bacterium]|nr:ComEC/Rec2 family competence protein [Clostridia bacterium]